MLVSLPGTTSAFATADIFARASGYIAKRYVDIGDQVKQGQLLAEISAPEIDHQIAQAQATLSQSEAALRQQQANADLASVTWGRDKPLVEKGWVTAQQGDVDRQNLQAQQAAVGVAQSNVAAQQAQIKVLQQAKDYLSVLAPFDGVVTRRNIDVGSLVQADATTGTFMFTVMQTNVIRTQVYVPQDQAFGVAPGVEAVVRVPELPDRGFPGKVTRMADALDPLTRTLLTEIDVPNPDGALPSGVYCSGRAAYSAQDAVAGRARRRHHLRCPRRARRRDRERRGAYAQGDHRARFRHAGGSERRAQGWRPGDPQPVGQSCRRQQGPGAATSRQRNRTSRAARDRHRNRSVLHDHAGAAPQFFRRQLTCCGRGRSVSDG